MVLIYTMLCHSVQKFILEIQYIVNQSQNEYLSVEENY